MIFNNAFALNDQIEGIFAFDSRRHERKSLALPSIQPTLNLISFECSLN